MALDRALRRELDRLQFGRHPRAVLIDQLPTGYGGQLAGRLLGLKVGLASGRKAIFLHDSDPPYVQSLVRPFSQIDDLSVTEDLPFIESFQEDSRELVRFNYFVVEKALKQRGVVVQWAEKALASKFQLSQDQLAKLDGWLISWLQFVPAFEAEIRRDIERLGISRNVLGVHIRRGDKKVETAYVPSERLNDAIASVYSAWKFDSIFVATDDADSISELNIPEGVSLIFDSKEIRYNNANHKMLVANPQMAAQETYVAFKNVRLLCECGGIVGQDNAHFATLAASYVLNRDSEARRIVLIDGKIAQKTFPHLRLLFLLKWTVRSCVKRVFPRRVLSWVDQGLHRR